MSHNYVDQLSGSSGVSYCGSLQLAGCWTGPHGLAWPGVEGPQQHMVHLGSLWSFHP